MVDLEQIVVVSTTHLINTHLSVVFKTDLIYPNLLFIERTDTKWRYSYKQGYITLMYISRYILQV